MDTYEHAAAALRETDPDRFIADLFVPVGPRRHLHALHAFDAEIRRFRHLVSEPALGEIRLQWWRDAIANDAGAGNPLAEALLATIRDVRLPRPTFDNLLAARIFDFYNDPMPSMADFEGYAGETDAAVFQLSALALSGGEDPGSADASGHAGVASALTTALRDFSLDAGRQQLFLPRDRFEVAGVHLDDVFARRTAPELLMALTDLRETARNHLARARAAIAGLPAAVVPAYLPLALVERQLKQLEKDAASPFDAPRPIAQWRRQLTLWRAARRGRP